MYEHTPAFAERKRRKYGLIDNLLYFLREAKITDKKLFYFQLLPIIPCVLNSVIGTILPSEVVRGLEEQWSIAILAGYIGMLTVIMWLSNIAYGNMQSYLFHVGKILQIHFVKKCSRKIMSMDYDLLEEPENEKLIGNTWRVLRNNYSFGNTTRTVPSLFSATAVVMTYAILILRKSVLLMLLLIVSKGISMWMLSVIRKKHGQCHEELSRYSKEAAYISRQAVESSAGKDIRIYWMMDWFLKKYDEALAGMDTIFEKIHDWYHGWGTINAVMGFMTEGFAWGYLLYLLVQGRITMAEFVLYIGLTNSLSTHFEALLRVIMNLAPTSVGISYIREFMELPNRWGVSDDEGASTRVCSTMEEVSVNVPKKGLRDVVTGCKENVVKKESETKTLEFSPGVVEVRQRGNKEKKCKVTPKQLATIASAAVKLELKDVSYTYPGKEEPTISHVNLTIRPGETLALLGLNGAGKTTLVKLICGFYQPTEGEVLLNDIPITHFDREDYYSLLSVLFQDITLLPLTLDENLTGECAALIDRHRLNKALKIAGFWEKYESLPKKGETLMVREVNQGALDFSGGEKQKMLFARALYKQAPLLILDEPTAALDPIAENELYQKYGEATKGRTSIYISHRLSSTRFCDRIILLEHGRIIEEGTHDSLMAKDSRYAELFAVQSKYYKEQEKKKQLSSIMGDTYTEDNSEKEGIFYE